MTDPTASQTVSLPPKTQFTSCKQFDKDNIWSLCGAKELRNTYNGQIKQTQDKVAEFASALLKNPQYRPADGNLLDFYW